MQNLLLIIGLIVLSLLTISMIWSVWPYVVTLLALARRLFDDAMTTP